MEHGHPRGRKGGQCPLPCPLVPCRYPLHKPLHHPLPKPLHLSLPKPLQRRPWCPPTGAGADTTAPISRPTAPPPWHPLRAQAPLPVPRFWFVWRVGEGAPKRRHETAEGARGEARRLANLHPGKPWLIYAAELVESVPSVQEGEPP
jgi:hypothetical protein